MLNAIFPPRHHTAVVHENASIGEGTTIGPYCEIGPNAVIGKGCRLEHCTVDGQIGDNTKVWRYAHVMGGNDLRRKNSVLLTRRVSEKIANYSNLGGKTNEPPNKTANSEGQEVFLSSPNTVAGNRSTKHPIRWKRPGNDDHRPGLQSVPHRTRFQLLLFFITPNSFILYSRLNGYIFDSMTAQITKVCWNKGKNTR